MDSNVPPALGPLFIVRPKARYPHSPIVPERKAQSSLYAAKSDVLDLGGGHTLPLEQVRRVIEPAEFGHEKVPVKGHTLALKTLRTSAREPLYIGGQIGAGHHAKVHIVAFFERDMPTYRALKIQKVNPERYGGTENAQRELETRVLTEVELMRDAPATLAPLAVFGTGYPHDKLMTLSELQYGNVLELSHFCVDETSRARLAEAVFVQLSPALRDLHERFGIYSRDIKPENMLVSGRGDVLLSDFGMGTRAPTSDAGMGTAEHMAPEVILHRLGVLHAMGRRPAPYDNAAAELWSFGTTLLHLFAGRAPFGCAGVARMNVYAHVDHLQRFVGEHAEAWAAWPHLRRLDAAAMPSETPHPLETWLAESLAPAPRGSEALAAAFEMVRYSPAQRVLSQPVGGRVGTYRAAKLRDFVRQLAFGLSNDVHEQRVLLDKKMQYVRAHAAAMRDRQLFIDGSDNEQNPFADPPSSSSEQGEGYFTPNG